MPADSPPKTPGLAAAMFSDPPPENAGLLCSGHERAEGPTRELFSRPRLCAGGACACALVVAAAAAALVFGVGAQSHKPRSTRGTSAQSWEPKGFLTKERYLMSPPPAWLAWPLGANVNTSTMTTTTSTITTSTATTTEGPGANQRKLFRIIKNPDGTVSIRTANGGYISVNEEGSFTNEAGIGEWECFDLLEHGDGSISLKAWSGSYLGAKAGQLKVSSKIGSAEKLTIVEKEDGAIALEASDGSHVSIDAFSDEPGRFAVNTRYATGPDAAEKFDLQENPDGTVSLTCFHGSYLSVEDSGSVFAGSLTVGKEQKFKRHQNSDGTISLFAVRIGRYLTAHPNDEGRRAQGTVSANGTKPDKWEKFELVEQNRTDGKIAYSFKAWDGKYLSVSNLPVFTFYMYRAQSDVDYEWKNVNTATLGGVMWYLHNEVVCFKPRKFQIQRIIRMKVQVTSTKALYEKGLNFGVRFAYDGGECTGAGPINGHGSCEDPYARLGHFVGCNYLGDYPFPMAVKGYPSWYEQAAWYSLPLEGACHGIPTGEDNCTYSQEDAGSIFIRDLYDMGDYYWTWDSEPGSLEYDKDSDTGVGIDFWKGKADPEANANRVRRAMELFEEKYPDMPSGEDYPDPVCDFNGKRFYTAEELERVGGECLCSASPNARSFFPEVDWDQCGFDPLSGLQGAGFYPTR